MTTRTSADHQRREQWWDRRAQRFRAQTQR